MNTQHLFDIEYTKELAERIKSVDLDDTTLRDHYDELMNTLTRGFGFTLVMCPECSCILQQSNTAIPDEYHEIILHCPVCEEDYEGSECPDLFF